MTCATGGSFICLFMSVWACCQDVCGTPSLPPSDFPQRRLKILPTETINNRERTNVWIKCSAGQISRLHLFSHSAVEVPQQLSAGKHPSNTQLELLALYGLSVQAVMIIVVLIVTLSHPSVGIGQRGGRIGGRGKRKRCEPPPAAETPRLRIHKETIKKENVIWLNSDLEKLEFVASNLKMFTDLLKQSELYNTSRYGLMRTSSRESGALVERDVCISKRYSLWG